MKTCVIPYGLLLILLITSISSAVNISPETMELNLIGGDFITREIAILNSHSYYVGCKVSTVILPDGDGINVTYSNSAFTIVPHTTFSLEIRINTSINLKPCVYTIETKLEFTNQDEVIGFPATSSSVFHHVIPPAHEETLIPLGDVPPEDNETILDDGDDTTIINVEIPPSFPFLELISFFFILSLIILFTLLMLRRKMEKKKK